MKSIGETALLTTPEYRKFIPAERIESSILLIRGEKFKIVVTPAEAGVHPAKDGIEKTGFRIR